MKFLIIGYGSAGKRHSQNILKIYNNAKIIILTRERKNFKVSRNIFFFNYKNLKNLLIQKFEAIFICTGANEHIRLANKFFNVTDKIFIEKPISNNLPEVKKFLKKIRQFKKKILIGYNIIFSESLVKLKEILKKKGTKILKGNIRTGYDLRKWRKISYSKSVSADKRKGGGVLLELSHDLNYLIWLLGKPLWVSASLSKISNLKINTEDNAFLLVGFNKFTVSLDLDFISQKYERSFIIYTQKNIYSWQYLRNTLNKFSVKKNSFLKIYNYNRNNNNLYMNQLKFFLKNENRKKFQYLLNISYLTLKLIVSARKSDKLNSKKIKLLY